MADFVADDFAFHDIPDSINYILSTTEQPSLSYIGFSQGTAQAFATLSIHPSLNSKVDVFVALAPAMAPPGLASGIVSSLVKSNPEVLYLAFGRRAMLGSTTMWQAILYPGIFSWVIDKALSFLFGWKMANIAPHQKLAAYPHLYSFTSTKSVVHWFQIIRNGKFQMFDDEVTGPGSFSTGSKYYKVAKFPTRNIKTPIVLVYGGSDSLVDINLMLKELPKHTVAKCVPKYEHLDLLWASDVEVLVFPHVLEALNNYATPSSTKREALGWTKPLEFPSRNIFDSIQPPGYSDDEQSRRMPETPISESFRPPQHEQMDESDEEDESTNSREGLMLPPCPFGHASPPPGDQQQQVSRTLPVGLLPSEILVRASSSSAFGGTRGTNSLQNDRPLDDGTDYVRQESPPLPGISVDNASTATDQTVVRRRPEGWWSSTCSSASSMLEPERRESLMEG